MYHTIISKQLLIFFISSDSFRILINYYHKKLTSKHKNKKGAKQPVKIPDFQTRYFYGGTIGS